MASISVRGNFVDNVEDHCCVHPNIIQSNEYYVCTNCGLVHDNIIIGLLPRITSSEDLNKKKK